MFILPVRKDKLLKVPVGEFPRAVLETIEAALSNGNDGGEVDAAGVVFQWAEWDEFANDMRMKELAEELAKGPPIRGEVIGELIVLIRDGIE